MPNLEQRQKAEAFRKLHTERDVLLLPNVWDVASARIVEDAGFPAIATSSAGIAFAQGFPDGQKIPPGSHGTDGRSFVGDVAGCDVEEWHVAAMSINQQNFAEAMMRQAR